VIPRGALVAKHGLGLLKLPSGSASISFPELGDIEGTAIRSNPGSLLSREQKKEASEKIALTKASRVEDIAEMASISAAETTAAFSSSRLSCPRCPAKFTSPKRLENHEKSDCGRYAKAILRRKIHDARTIRARMRRNDDDLAEEAEMLEEEGLDIVHYHGETEAVESHHISQFQVGSGAEVAVLSTRPAVVASVVPGGAVSQELVAVGFGIVSVDGIICPDFTAAFNALTVATTRRLNVVPDGPKRGTTV